MCQLALFQLLVSLVKLLPAADFQLFEANFSDKHAYLRRLLWRSRPTGPALEKERCVELCCAAFITNNRTTEIRKRGVLCCFYKISHLCAYLKSRKTLRYGVVQRPLYILYKEKNRPLKRLGRLAPARQ